jgi:hypothetical protein
MAGTDRRSAQVSAEISGCEIRHCVVTARHALFFTRIGFLIPLPVICYQNSNITNAAAEFLRKRVEGL